MAFGDLKLVSSKSMPENSTRDPHPTAQLLVRSSHHVSDDLKILHCRALKRQPFVTLGITAKPRHVSMYHISLKCTWRLYVDWREVGDSDPRHMV